MKMKKFLALFLVVTLGVVVLAGCGSSSSSSSTAESTEAPSEASADTTEDSSSSESSEAVDSSEFTPLNIIAAHGSTEAVAQHTSWVYLAQILEERSGGAVTMEIYPNQQLGGDREYTEACIQGNVTMGAPSTAAIGALAPSLNAFETPFLFSDYETARATMDGEAAQALLDSLESIGLKGLGFYENGFRNLTCNKEIDSVDDLDGLKIRTMENEIHLAIWTALGANPAPLAYGELYTALQQGSFDAQENPLEQIYNNKFYEVQDHVYLTQHIYTPYIVYMNLDVWNGLNEKTQQLIEECFAESVQNNRETCDTNNQACIEGINSSGKSQVYEVSDELRQEMIQACKDGGVYDQVKEAAGGTYAEDLWADAGFEY